MKGKERKNGYLKGQAVMEYLITYGLALLVILIVLGILFAVVLPMLKPPTTCKFQDPTFSCEQKEHVVVADSSNNVRIIFQLDNTGGKAIEVKGILCTTASTGNIQRANIDDFEGGTVDLPSAGSKVFGDVGSEIKCYDEDGTQVNLAANSNFKGALAVKYKYKNDITGAPDRMAIATVTATVQAE